ncbi:MAG: DUF1501 domain-containing protein [Actinomycetota bacterium]
MMSLQQARETVLDASCSSCVEEQQVRRLSRRSLLQGSIAAGAAVALSEHLTVRYAQSANLPGTDTLVVLFLRGGFDGLSAVVPVTDEDYYAARPKIAIPREATVALNSRYGLHPALSPLKTWYDRGSFGIVQATGLTSANRSHFSAMEEVERAAPGSYVRTGWLDRTLGLRTLSEPAPLRSTSLGYRAPRSTSGPHDKVTMKTIKDFKLAGTEKPATAARWDQALRTLYANSTLPVNSGVTSMLNGLSSAAQVATVQRPAGSYPDSDLGKALRDAARLITSDQPISVITIDEGDWDMHVDLGTVDRGWMRTKLTDLGRSLAAFAEDLGDAFGRVTLVTMSEFGRRTEENASGGVDHGWGNAMFLLGGGVRGGTVHGEWPGLNADNLHQGDLKAVTDYRAVLADVLQNRCGATREQAREVFPGWSGSSLGVTNPRA